MPNYNTITVVGHVGKDCENTFTPGGAEVSRFSLAYNDKRAKTTLWFDVTLWGKHKLAQYIIKGKAIGVTGTLGRREWEGKDGSKQSSLTLNGSDVLLLGGDERDGGQTVSAPRSSRPAAPAQEIDDSDLPF